MQTTWFFVYPGEKSSLFCILDHAGQCTVHFYDVLNMIEHSFGLWTPKNMLFTEPVVGASFIMRHVS